MLIIDMQTRPFLIITACIFECSRHSGGGLERQKINLPQKYQIIYLNFPFSPSLLHNFPRPHCLLFANSRCASEPQRASASAVSSPTLPPTPWRTTDHGRARRVWPRTTQRCGIWCRRRRTGSVEDWSSLPLR